MWTAVSNLNRTSRLLVNSVRGLKLLEHVGLELLEGDGLKIAHFTTAQSVDTISTAYNTLTKRILSNEIMLKAQVMTGGRGRGVFDSGLKGGVHVVRSSEEAERIGGQMIGYKLITKQTGEAGQSCNKIMLAEKKIPKQEYYFAIVLDRENASPVLIGSAEGGMNIEELARDHPEKVFRQVVNVEQGLTKEVAIKLATNMRFGSDKLVMDAANTMLKLYSTFIKNDCTLLEINPLAVDTKDEVICMDCKIQIDDNAYFKHQVLFDTRDKSGETELDLRAEEAGVNYIKLNGNIGCLVNGAGLAMATMDLIKIHGGNPANFLDVGGGANKTQITEAFRIICSDKNVKVILVNIFGGILRCDLIAAGIVNAVKEIGQSLPIVVRLQGTQLEEARKILDSSHIEVFAIDDLDEAAKKAVSFCGSSG